MYPLLNSSSNLDSKFGHYYKDLLYFFNLNLVIGTFSSQTHYVKSQTNIFNI